MTICFYYFRFCEHYQQSLTAVTSSHIEFTWSHQTGGRPDASAMLQGKTSPVGHTKGARVSEVQLVNHSPGYAEPGPSTSTGKLLHAVNVHALKLGATFYCQRQHANKRADEVMSLIFCDIGSIGSHDLIECSVE